MLSESELDARLHKCDPINRAALDTERVRAALASMELSIESGAHRQAPTRSTRRLAYRRRSATLGAAAVAVASLVGVETFTGGGGGAGLPLAVPPAAAAQLNEIAHAAAGQVTPGAGQWTYVESRYSQPGTATVGDATITFTEAYTEQNWYAPDGAARERAVTNGVSFATPQDRATYLTNESAFSQKMAMPAPWPVGKVTNDDVINDPGRPLHISQEDHPPTDPQALIKEDLAFPTMSHGVVSPNRTPEPPWVIWTDLSQMLMNSPSAQLRATAYAALAYVPYTKVLGPQTDQLGRSGIAISFAPQGRARDGGDTEWTLIVSPGTGDLLEEDSTMATASGGLRAGTLVSREIFVTRALVDSDTALPGGGTVPEPGPQTTTATTTQTPTTPAPGMTTATTSETTTQTSTAPAAQTTTATASQTPPTAPNTGTTTSSASQS
jgi:hypothetical protein